MSHPYEPATGATEPIAERETRYRNRRRVAVVREPDAVLRRTEPYVVVE